MIQVQICPEHIELEESVNEVYTKGEVWKAVRFWQKREELLINLGLISWIDILPTEFENFGQGEGMIDPDIRIGRWDLFLMHEGAVPIKVLATLCGISDEELASNRQDLPLIDNVEELIASVEAFLNADNIGLYEDSLDRLFDDIAAHLADNKRKSDGT